MGVEIEGLEFQIKASSDKGVKSIDTLVETLKKLKRAAKGNNAMSEVTEQINKLDIALSTLHNEKIEKLTSSLESLGRLGNIKISATLPKRINEIADSIHSITSEDVERMQNLSNAFEKMSNADIPKFNLGKGRATTTGSTEEPLVPKDSGVETATSQIVNATDKVNIFKQAMSGVGTIFQKTFGFLGEMGSRFKSMGRAISTTNKAMISFVKVAMKLPMLVGRRLANQVKQTTSAFGNFFSSLKRIAFYRMIRFIISSITQGFKDGMANLYQYSLIMGTDFAKSMDKLATSALYLKNSLGAMVSPLINALAPAIEFVVDKFVDLLNVINQVIAKLSGNTTYTAARKVATSWQEAADDTKKAVNEIKRYTLGFDELNILGKNNSDSSKGKENTTDYTSMFEERPIESSIGDFTNRLKEMVLSGDWESIGRTIGDKINYAVDHIEWAGTGTKIGTGINGAVKSVYYLLDTINFTNIGSKIATLFNNTLAAIDFEFVGRLIVKPFTAIGDLIIGAIETVDFGLVAQKLSEGIKGIFNEASDWLNKVDWEEFGKSLYKDLKAIFTNIDYEGLAKSFFRFLGSAIRAATTTLGTFIGELAIDLSDMSVNYEFGDISLWIYDNIITPIAEGLFDADISEIEEAWDRLWSDILDNPVCEFIVKVKDTSDQWIADVKKYWNDGVEMIGDFFVEVKDTHGDWKHQVLKYWNLIAAVTTPFVYLTVGIINTVSSWVASIKKYWTIGTNEIVSFVAGVKNTVGTWKNNLVKYWTLGSTEIGKFLVGVKNNASTWWKNVKSWWSEKVSSVQSFTTGAKNQASTWWKNVKSWWDSKVGKVSEFTTNAKNQASTWWSSVKSWWNSKVGKVSEFTTGVKNNALTWWTNVKSWWDSKVGKVSEFTTNAKNQASTWWSSVKSKWNNYTKTLSLSFDTKPSFSGWVDALNTAWDNLKAWWTTKKAELVAKLSIKTPHLEIVWGNAAGLSYPKDFNIKWNAKGGILNGAQLFGIAGNQLLGGGEAGREAVLPLDTHTEWMDSIAERVRREFSNGYTEESIVEGVRTGVNEASVRQNELLREQNELLRQILAKETSVEITTNSFTKAINRKNQRDGKTVIPVGT